MKFFEIAVFAALLTVFAAPVFAQTAPDAIEKAALRPLPEPAVRDAFDLLMISIQENDYAGFMVAVDEDFKAALTKEIFEKVVNQVAPRLKKGFQTTYLDQLKKNGYAVHVWKIEFDDKGNDLLAELSLKNQKIGGFFLR